MDNNQLFSALGTFLDAMRPFLVSLLEKNYPGEPWEGVFFNRLTPEKQNTWNAAGQQGIEPSLRIDYHNLTFLASKFYEELCRELGGDKNKARSFGSTITELKAARDKCQHFTPIDDDEQLRAFSNMTHIANMLGMGDLSKEIKRLENIAKRPVLHRPTSEERNVKAIERKPETYRAIDDSRRLQSWFDNCYPHYDIRAGRLDESVFAANLNDVVLNNGREVYANPAEFFKKTYITAGLRDIINRVVRALNGEASENRIISLQTGFGGGKTHTLISIFHIAKSGSRLLNSDVCRDILQEGVTPHFEEAGVAVFTNNTTDTLRGRTTAEGITIYTLWGEIAYQLGGVEAYEKVRENDEQRIAPASSVIKPIIEAAGASLILIDELADYCVKAQAKTVGDSNLFNQTNSFIQTLTEVVSSLPKCVLIATLPASATEVADTQIGQTILDALQNRIARIGTGIKPVDDDEIFEVVRRRLFESVDDRDIVRLVADRYKKMYSNRRGDLPENCTRMEYALKIEKAYPFHPELIDVFRHRWGSDPKFQRTRGVLQLLASIVQDLWQRRQTISEPQLLIHTSDVNLGNLSSLTGKITSMMGSNWESVMIADVYGASSNARKIDDTAVGDIGKYHLAQSVATTLLMASVGSIQNKGLDIKQLKLCMLRPDAFNHNEINSVLDKLEQEAHYLYSSKVGKTYWFESKANINILLNQAKNNISKEELTAEISTRLNSECKSSQALKVLVAPTSDVPEQKQLTMVILSPEYVISSDNSIPPAARRMIEGIALRRGNTAREYRNTIFYLACSEQGRDVLNDKLRDYLSCVKIENDGLSRLEKEQQSEIKRLKEEHSRDVDVALVQAYSKVLIYHTKSQLEIYDIRNYAPNFRQQVGYNLLPEMKEAEYVIDRIGRSVLSNNNLLPTSADTPIRINDIYEAFLRYDDKPMITGVEAIIKTVNKFCLEGKYKVGVKNGNGYSRIFVGEEIPSLDVTDTDYFLLHNSVEPGNAESGKAKQRSEETVATPSVKKINEDDQGPKTYRAINIRGNVSVTDWTNLFTSFIQTLKDNNLQLNVSIRAKSTEGNPLTENSRTVKIVKESASQLGLDFLVEE